MLAESRGPRVKAKATSNPIVLRPGINIGAAAAEYDDELLFECFEDNGIYGDLKNPTSPRYLLKGRTGSGKTAFLRYLEKQHPDHTIRIDPNFLCLQYISNSDIIRYLNDCQVNIEPFFQIIWRHAICTELLKRRYRIDDPDKARSMWDTLLDRLQPNKRRAIEYLQSLGIDLWPDMEARVTQIAKKVESQIDAELKGYPASIGARNTVTAEERAEVQQRINRILCAEQLSNLAKVIDFLAEDVFNDEQHLFYILIDDLDKFIVDDEIRFLLLRALIESVRKFRSVRRVKFCIAVRSDILELIFDHRRHPGFQTEKFEDSILEIRWSKDQLIRLADTRIKVVFKRQYTGAQVTFDELFPNQIDKRSAKEYMIERTLRRPRDIIAFVNQCFIAATDHKNVSTRLLREAEGLYSEKRRTSLIEEWSEAHPLIQHYFAPLQNKKASFRPDALFGRDTDDFISALASAPDADSDPIGKLARAFYSNAHNEWEVMQAWLAAMYKFGAIGVKNTPQSPVAWSMSDAPVVKPHMFTYDSHIEIHPMLYRTLGVAPKQ